ncbi:MAG TPA: L-threonylcarbamoyladenylate synthase [Thermoanaerobaculaceae bacterium]|nr:L-threonylcarbamoyladenylate synthase [Thermoanaerobaculaceae bacterium]HRS15484.1 L-threonylcarbamoyladenylate synthase [Thermoanaerobaculaceae bacterium]
MPLHIDPTEPESWLVARVVQVLKRGGVVVLPTDTVYAFACALSRADAIERLYGVKEISGAKRLSIMVPDIATASRFTRGIPNHVFRAMRRVLPGPYTFIFQASHEVPKIMLHKRRTVGLRIPDNAIVQAVLAELGEPLLASSVRNAAEEFLLDPVVIADALAGKVDLVVGGGVLVNEPSTVVDLSEDEPELVRRGKGDVEALELF